LALHPIREFEDRERSHAHHLKAGQDDETDALHGRLCAIVLKRRLNDLCDMPPQAQISPPDARSSSAAEGGGPALPHHRPPPAIWRSGSSTCLFNTGVSTCVLF